MKKLIIIVFAFGLFVSCNKDKDKCNLDQASVSGSYKITAVRYKATPASPEVDYYGTFFPDPCERDDIITLNSNGSYTYTDAGVKCVPPGDDTGTWSLTGNTITIDGTPANVDNYDCATITISEADYFNVGDKLILVLTRQ